MSQNLTAAYSSVFEQLLSKYKYNTNTNKNLYSAVIHKNESEAQIRKTSVLRIINVQMKDLLRSNTQVRVRYSPFSGLCNEALLSSHRSSR